ncbi:hypothetical protein [Mycolicibacterium sp. F2034L]|uniref:hypothetical protein n=1 Tax=Mycolicibacterium sp. F2034L TaxID=2926422 RepID=UPI001FF0EE94|nr:hypothetical protein [Mycolicibacterium sp. F2034L]MCK0174817.1 hypothetical protein [Mycolicibacterium sp. F2034L]
MIPGLTPEAWNGVGVVTVLILVVAYHAIAYIRGWLVPGRHHREIVAAQDLRLAAADDRDKANAETIRIQAQTIAEKNAVELTTAHLLESVRELAQGKAGA